MLNYTNISIVYIQLPESKPFASFSSYAQQDTEHKTHIEELR